MNTEATFKTSNSITSIAATPSLQELIKRAEALQPLLKKNTVACEKERRTCDENIEAIRDAGLCCR